MSVKKFDFFFHFHTQKFLHLCYMYVFNSNYTWLIIFRCCKFLILAILYMYSIYVTIHVYIWIISVIIQSFFLSRFISEWVESREINPVFSSSHFTGTDPTIDLMDYLLNCLTVQVGRLKWGDTSKHVKGFSFLFFQFKLFYLACLYRNFRSDAGLYCQPPIPIIGTSHSHFNY